MHFSAKLHYFPSGAAAVAIVDSTAKHTTLQYSVYTQPMREMFIFISSPPEPPAQKTKVFDFILEKPLQYWNVTSGQLTT